MSPNMLRELALLYSIEGAGHEYDAEANRLLAIGDELAILALGFADTIRAPAESGVFKTCTCCGEHLTAEQWIELPYVGRMDAGDGEPGIELRNHDCGSTIAVEVAWTTEGRETRWDSGR